jgi:ATP-binding cassette subfamily F protein 3
VLVSHDRSLLRATTDDLFLVADGKVEEFNGDLDDYAKWLNDYRALQLQASAEPGSSDAKRDRKADRQRAAEIRNQLRPLKKQIEKLETEIAKLEAGKKAIEEQLADPALYDNSNKARLAELLKQQGGIRNTLEEKEMAWMEASEQLQQMESELS